MPSLSLVFNEKFLGETELNGRFPGFPGTSAWDAEDYASAGGEGTVGTDNGWLFTRYGDLDSPSGLAECDADTAFASTVSLSSAFRTLGSIWMYGEVAAAVGFAISDSDGQGDYIVLFLEADSSFGMTAYLGYETLSSNIWYANSLAEYVSTTFSGTAMTTYPVLMTYSEGTVTANVGDVTLTIDIPRVLGKTPRLAKVVTNASWHIGVGEISISADTAFWTANIKTVET